MNKFETTLRKILNSPLGIIIFIVSLAAFYPPYELEIIPVYQTYVPYARYICGGFLIIAFFMLYISRLRFFRDNWYLIGACVFIAALIYSTILSPTGFMEGALGSKGLLSIFLVMTFAVFLRSGPKQYLLIGFFIFLAVNIANTYCIYHYWGTGLWEVWQQYRHPYISIVGNYNGGVEYVLPMAILGSAYAHRYGRWMDYINYPAMVMSLIMAFKVNSETQKAVFIAIILFMLIGNICMISNGFAKVIRWIFNPVLLTLVNLVFFISVIWMNKTAWLARFGADPGFHGRRSVWDKAISLIKSNPLWGSGFESVDMKAMKLGNKAHCHSFFLEIPYMMGIIGVIIASILIIILIVAIIRCRNSSIAFMMSGMLFALCLTNLFETYGATFFVFGLGLIYYVVKCCGDGERLRRRR